MSNILPYTLIGNIATNKTYGSIALLIRLMEVFPEYENELKENNIWEHFLDKIKRTKEERVTLYKKHEIYNFFKANWNKVFKTYNMKPFVGDIGDYVTITMFRDLRISFYNASKQYGIWLTNIIPNRTVNTIVCSENIISIKVDNPTGLFVSVLDMIDTTILGPEHRADTIVMREILPLHGTTMKLLDIYWANAVCMVENDGLNELYCYSMYKNNGTINVKCERVQIQVPNRNIDITQINKTPYHCGPTTTGYHFFDKNNEFYKAATHQLYRISVNGFTMHAIFGHFNDTTNMYKIVPSNLLPIPIQFPSQN